MNQVQQLNDIVRSGDFLILDTETTGLNRGEIVQIAVVNSKGETCLDTLLKPVNPIPRDATRIHSITDQMVAFSPTFPEIFSGLKTLLTGTNVIVYNATYDRKMLHQSAEAWQIPKTDWKSLSPWHCAMEAFAEIYGEWNDRHGNYKWQTLSRAADYYGLEVVDAHNALGDCLMTLGVCRKMAEGIKS